MSQIESLLEFLALAGALWAGLHLVGYPLKALLLDGREDRSPVPSVVVGLAMVQVVGWYWLALGGRGLAGPAFALLGLGAVTTGVLVLRRGRRAPSAQDRPVWVAVAGAAVVFGVAFQSIFELGYQSTVSLGSKDALSYATFAQHLAERGFADPGQIVGFDLGVLASTDGFGATVILGAAAAVTGLGTWELAMPLMFVFVLLGACGLSRLMNELFPDLPYQGALASVAATASFLFLYTVGQHFLGQVMAMAVTPLLGVLALRTVSERAHPARRRLAAGVAVIAVVLISQYQQAAVLLLAVILPGALAAGWEAMRTAAPRALAVFAAGGLVAAVVVSPLLVLGVARAGELGDFDAGFALGGLLPVDLVGALDVSAPGDREIGAVAASAVLVVVFLACVALIRRGRATAARFAVITVALCLVGYGLAYAVDADSARRQWPWVTFFQPLSMALVLGCVVAALLDHRRLRSVAWAGPASWVALVGLIAVILATNGLANLPLRDGAAPAAASGPTLRYIDDGLADLGRDPGLNGMPALNVSVAADWDTAWAAYFLADRRLSLVSPSPYPIAKPKAAWTLTQRSPGLTSPSVQRLNQRFQIERVYSGPVSDSERGLDALVSPRGGDLTVETGKPIRIGVVVVNAGSSAWLPSGDGRAAVNLGAHLNRADGRPLNYDYRHQPLATGGRLITPGSVVRTRLEAPPLPPGRYRVDVQMVSELVAWFGPAVPVELRVTRRA